MAQEEEELIVWATLTVVIGAKGGLSTTTHALTIQMEKTSGCTVSWFLHAIHVITSIWWNVLDDRGYSVADIRLEMPQLRMMVLLVQV